MEQSGLDYVVYYAVGNVACIGILLIILYRSSYGVNLPGSFSALKRLVATLIFFLIDDCVWVWASANGAASNPVFSYITTTLNVILITACAYQWFCFCRRMVHEDAILRGRSRWKVQAPIVFVCVCYTLYLGSGFDLSNIDELNFVNASYLALFLVPVFYVVNASWRCFRYAIHHYEERELYMTFAFFAILPTIASLLQIPFWKVPLMCYAATASVIFTYLLLMESLISKDTLTQLANRTEMSRHLLRKLENPPEGRRIFVFMLDLDDFKGINDTYGHMEGDRALCTLADALRLTENRWKGAFFPARFGGDEFIVIGECEQEAEVEAAKALLRASLAELVSRCDLPYDIQASIGATVVEPGQMLGIQHVLELADKALYMEKHQRKTSRAHLRLMR